jgi:hypothetical protein
LTESVIYQILAKIGSPDEVADIVKGLGIDMEEEKELGGHSGLVRIKVGSVNDGREEKASTEKARYVEFTGNTFYVNFMEYLRKYISNKSVEEPQLNRITILANF